MENITIEYRNGRIMALHEVKADASSLEGSFTAMKAQDVTSAALRAASQYVMESEQSILIFSGNGKVLCRLKTESTDAEKEDTRFTETDKAETREQPLSDSLIAETMQLCADTIEKDVLWNWINQLRKETRKIKKRLKRAGL